MLRDGEPLAAHAVHSFERETGQTASGATERVLDRSRARPMTPEQRRRFDTNVEHLLGDDAT